MADGDPAYSHCSPHGLLCRAATTPYGESDAAAGHPCFRRTRSYWRVKAVYSFESIDSGHPISDVAADIDRYMDTSWWHAGGDGVVRSTGSGAQWTLECVLARYGDAPPFAAGDHIFAFAAAVQTNRKDFAVTNPEYIVDLKNPGSAFPSWPGWSSFPRWIGAFDEAPGGSHPIPDLAADGDDLVTVCPGRSLRDMLGSVTCDYYQVSVRITQRKIHHPLCTH